MTVFRWYKHCQRVQIIPVITEQAMQNSEETIRVVWRSCHRLSYFAWTMNKYPGKSPHRYLPGAYYAGFITCWELEHRGHTTLSCAHTPMAGKTGNPCACYANRRCSLYSYDKLWSSATHRTQQFTSTHSPSSFALKSASGWAAGRVCFCMFAIQKEQPDYLAHRRELSSWYRSGQSHASK